MKHTNKVCKEIKIEMLIVITLILSISASVFISKALYDENEEEINPEISSSLNLIKYVNYEDEGQGKAIVEFNLKEKVTYNNDYYSPVKENSVYVKIPEIAGQLPEKVEVISISSKATNGDDRQRQAKYEYNPENRNLHIYEKNEADEDGKIYYGNSSNYDEYEIIIYYNNKIELSDENNQLLNIPVLVRYDITNEQIGYMQKIFTNEIELQEKGNIISTEIDTQKIYNGYINSNITNGTEYETEFSQETIIYISELNAEEIILKEQNGFRNVNNEIKQSSDITYKQIKINKQDILRVLGEDGFLQILDEEENVLAEVNKDYCLKNEEIAFNLEEKNSSLIIKTSKPINKGLIRIYTIKSIEPEMKDLSNTYVVTVQKIIGNQIKEKNEIEENKIINDGIKEYETKEINSIIEEMTIDETEIKNALTKVNVTLDNKEWTNSISNNVNIIATLVTPKNEYNLFKNPSLEIELPEHVEKIVLGKSYLLNANGLYIENVDVVDKTNGRKSIIAKLGGNQTEYLFDNMINGTNIVIPATIILEKGFESNTNKINISYSNEVRNDIENGTSELTVNLESIIENKIDENIQTVIPKEADLNSDIQTKTTTEEISSVEQIKLNNGLTVDIVAKVGDEVAARSGTNESNNIQNGIVYERQIIKYNVTLTNNTENEINNISVIGGIPNYSNYATVEKGKTWDEEKGQWVDNIQDDIVYKYVIDEEVQNYELKNINTLKPGETISDWYEVKLKDLEDNLDSTNIVNNVLVKIGDKEYDTFKLSNELHQAKIEVKLKAQPDLEQADSFAYKIDIVNLTDEELNNIYVEISDIPKELQYNESIVMYSENASGNGVMEDNKFKITLDKIRARTEEEKAKGYEVYASINIRFLGTNYDEKQNEIALKMTAKAVINNTTYWSNENRINAYPQYVTAVMSLDKEGQEVKQGEELTYSVIVKNESKVKSLINIVNNLPEELEGIEATYLYYDVGDDTETRYDIEAEENAKYELVEEKIDLSVKGIPSEEQDNEENIIKSNDDNNEDEDPTVEIPNDDIYIPTVLPAGKTLKLTIRAKAGYVDKDTNVSNFVTVYGESIKTVISNITNVKILTNVDWDYINGEDPEKPNTPDVPDTPDNPNFPEEPNGKDDVKHSISGTVWLDENEDGRRTENEERLTGITVKLFNAETNEIATIDNNKMITMVDSNGKYIFNNIPKGKYYCLFEYDTQHYKITSYQKSGVSSEFNNDVNKASVNIDGIEKIVGITDVLVIDNSNLEDIDLGLIEEKNFDLKLEKYISRVIITTSKGTKESTYDNTSLAKVEIPSKEIEGSIVTIEYKFVITNEGNIEGYVNEVTDYIPKELSFGQTNNGSWILENNGNVKNTSLTSTKISPGESKTLTLYLTKTMTNTSTGIIKNSAEITESSNIKNLKDIDSTANNQSNNEDDYDSADILISISTGFYKNIMIVILTVIIITILIYFIKKHNIKHIKKLPTIMMTILAIILIGTNISYGSWYENIIWVAGGGVLSNGWHCTYSGAHQCAVGSHTYVCSKSSKVVKSENIIDKKIKISEKSSTKKFIYLDSNYNLVGPYKVESSHGIKSSKITANLAGGTSYIVCDSTGKEISWSSGKTFNFYLKVPKSVTAVTKVTVTATIAKVSHTESKTKVTYKARCISVGGSHQDGGNNYVSVTPGECQTAGKTKTKTNKEYKDGNASITFASVYAGSLTIRKYDADIKNSEGGELELSSTCGALFTVKDSAGHIIATSVKPKTTLTGLPSGTYTVTETAAPNGYKLELQGKEEKTATTKTAVVNGSSAPTRPTTVEFKFYNKKYGYNLIINKTNGTTNTELLGAGFKIYAELTDGTKGWVSGQVEGDKTYGNVATEYSSKVQIKNLKKGTYYIYETKAPIGYDITTQDGYDPKNGWVNYGKVTIGDNNTNTDTSVTIYNSKYTKITGKVWLEHEMQTKTDSSYNNVYDSERDDLLKDIHVELIDKRITDPNQNVIATATTQQNGTYVIEKLKDNSKIIYDNLYNYYIRFSYDKENYITVAADLAENKPNASRALETKITAQDLDDNNLKQTTGYAVTYQNATGDKDGLGRYYNNNSHCVENVNLGLIRKIKPEYSINQNIEYVKIVRGNYTFKYKYGNEIEIENDESKFFPSVQLQNSSRSFTQPIYPSDIKYNIANKLTGNDSNAYKVYVVYKINVTNNTALDIENLYQEKALYLTELVNDYDGSRLELSHDVLNGDKTEISNDFGLWSDKTGDQASGTKTARFNVSASNKLYKEANRGISPKETESTYIEFKVKDEVLTELLTNEELRTAPTVAKSSGYHKYTRIDNSWTDNMSRKYEHKSISEDKEDAELYLKWKLTDARTVSGTVFEDSKVNQLDGENPDSRKDERIGDGKFIDGEKTLEDVIVSLIEIDEDNNGKLANLYDGELSQDITTGKWKTDKQPAVVKVNENGEYALKGVVPGRYYLKFTYGDGKTEIKDLNGNVVEKDVNNNTIEKISTKIKGEEQAINSNYYKSTILTGSAKDANNEKTWFLGDMDKTNSIATDNTITYFDKDGNLKQEEQDIITSRTTSDKEMNYTSSQDKAVIEAISPNMDIQFEYVENPEIEMNTNTELKTNCTGMYFGIIERPHVEIELNKEISNIILTLSNGTNIINGNPQDKNVSSSLTSMDASYAKIEMNNTYLYGSSATVTYNIIATNNSELDYATEEYYKKGVKTENDQPVTTTVTKIIDYTSNSNCEYVQGSGNVTLSYNDKDYENEGYKKDDYFVQIPDVRTNNKNYKDQLLVTKDELMPTKAKKEKNKANYFVTVKKLLSNLDDNLGWESYSEIIGLKNVTYTTQYSCHSGNYKAGDTEITPNTTSEADNAETILAISPSTGADKSYTYWIAGAIALIVIAGGIIFLKKKVLK